MAVLIKSTELTGIEDTDYILLNELDDSTLKNTCSIENRYIHRLCQNDRLWRERLIKYYGESSLMFKPINLSLRDYYFSLATDVIANKIGLRDKLVPIRKYSEDHSTYGSEIFHSLDRMLEYALQEDDEALLYYTINLVRIISKKALGLELTIGYDKVIAQLIATRRYQLVDELLKLYRSELRDGPSQYYFMNISEQLGKDNDTKLITQYELPLDQISFLGGLLEGNHQGAARKYYDAHRDEIYIEDASHFIFKYGSRELIEYIFADLSEIELVNRLLQFNRLDIAGNYEQILNDRQIYRALAYDNPELARKYYREDFDEIIRIRSADQFQNYPIVENLIAFIDYENISRIELVKIFNHLKGTNRYLISSLLSYALERSPFRYEIIRLTEPDVLSGANLIAFIRISLDYRFYDLAFYFASLLLDRGSKAVLADFLASGGDYQENAIREILVRQFRDKKIDITELQNIFR